MEDCIFCRIIAQADPAVILYHDDRVSAFKDRSPRAPVHLLVVPNRHFESMKDIEEQDEPLVGHMLRVAADLAAQNGLAANGFRLVINTGRDAGQSVFHLHLHLLGGKPLPSTFGWGFNGEA